MRVLVLTNMYPIPELPHGGTFIEEQVKALREEGVDVDVLFIHGRGNRLHYLLGIFRFWARLLTKRYDLIHAHYVFSGLIARTQFLYPIVLTHHGYEVFMTWQRYPSRMITPLVDKVIVVSKEQKEKLKCDKAEVIPCGIDLDLFRPVPRDEARRQLNLNASGKKLVLVLWAGETSRPEKRYDIVETAVALAREKDPMIEPFMVFGKPHDMIPLYMNASDVLLLVSDAEGSPVVIKEAMACNLPIVSVPVGDVPDVIGGTDGCFLCSQDPSDVAEKLLMALNRQKRTNGREKIKHLDQSVIAKRIVALYNEVLQHKNGKSGQRDREMVEGRE